MTVKAILGLALIVGWAGPAAAETTEYSIRFFRLPIGRASIEERRDGAGRIELVVRGRTNRLGSLIYSVNNTYVASIDGTTRAPLRLVKLIDEKSVRESLEIVFDGRHNAVRYGGREPMAVPSGTHNFFSALVLLRGADLTTAALELPVIAHGKLWKTTCRRAGSERLEMGGRQVACQVLSIRFAEMCEGEKAFAGRPDILTKELVHPKSELTLWLTEEADPRYARLVFRRSPFEVRLTPAPLPD